MSGTNMRNLLLASLLGSAAGAFTMPMIAGPVHFQYTRPHSVYGVAPSTPNATTPASVPLAPIAHDFVITDVTLAYPGGPALQVTVLVNGAPALALPSIPGDVRAGSVHLNTGVLIPAGATIALQVVNAPNAMPFTLVGYLQ
jgi:hypothetical protein